MLFLVCKANEKSQPCKYLLNEGKSQWMKSTPPKKKKKDSSSKQALLRSGKYVSSRDILKQPAIKVCHLDFHRVPLAARGSPWRMGSTCLPSGFAWVFAFPASCQSLSGSQQGCWVWLILSRSGLFQWGTSALDTTLAEKLSDPFPKSSLPNSASSSLVSHRHWPPDRVLLTLPSICFQRLKTAKNGLSCDYIRESKLLRKILKNQNIWQHVKIGRETAASKASSASCQALWPPPTTACSP